MKVKHILEWARERERERVYVFFIRMGYWGDGAQSRLVGSVWVPKAYLYTKHLYSFYLYVL